MAKSRTTLDSMLMPMDTFKQRVEALRNPTFTWVPGSWLHMSEVRDLLEPLTKTAYWEATPDSDAILSQHLQQANWVLSDGNFIHRSGDLYAWVSFLPVEERLAIRASQFGKLSAIGYALLCDVHPDRRPTLYNRLEYWSGMDIATMKNASSMLVALAEHWNYGQDGVNAALGSVLAEMDPSQARSAAFLGKIWERMADPSVELYPSEDNVLDIPPLN